MTAGVRRGASPQARPIIANAGTPSPANSQNQSKEPWISQYANAVAAAPATPLARGEARRIAPAAPVSAAARNPISSRAPTTPVCASVRNSTLWG